MTGKIDAGGLTSAGARDLNQQHAQGDGYAPPGVEKPVQAAVVERVVVRFVANEPQRPQIVPGGLGFRTGRCQLRNAPAQGVRIHGRLNGAGDE